MTTSLSIPLVQVQQLSINKGGDTASQLQQLAAIQIGSQIFSLPIYVFGNRQGNAEYMQCASLQPFQFPYQSVMIFILISPPPFKQKIFFLSIYSIAPAIQQEDAHQLGSRGKGDLGGLNSQISSMDSALTFDAGGCKFKFCQCQ